MTDKTLAFDDIFFADVDAEDPDDDSLVKVLKLRFGRDLILILVTILKLKFGQDIEVYFWSRL